LSVCEISHDELMKSCVCVCVCARARARASVGGHSMLKILLKQVTVESYQISSHYFEIFSCHTYRLPWEAAQHWSDGKLTGCGMPQHKRSAAMSTASMSQLGRGTLELLWTWSWDKEVWGRQAHPWGDVSLNLWGEQDDWII